MIDPYTRQERGPSPAAVLLERTRTALRESRRRPGIAQSQMFILAAVIVAIIILGGSGFVVYRSVTRGAEDGAMKATLDRVSVEVENYWQTYALDRSGRRAMPFHTICNYLNAQMTQESDLVLRSVVPAAAAPTALTATAVAIAAVPANLADIKQAGTAPTGAAARCGDDTGRKGYTSLHVAAGVDDGKWGAVAADGPDAGLGATGGTDTHQPGAWQDAGVFGAQTVGLVALTGASSAANATAAGQVPFGTDPTLEAIALVGNSSSGNQFCILKVLDANDRGHVGNYRYASATGKTVAADTALGQCLASKTPGNPGHIPESAWPNAD